MSLTPNKLWTDVVKTPLPPPPTKTHESKPSQYKIDVPGPFPLELPCIEHALERMKERKITPRQAADTLHLIPFLSYGKRVVFSGTDARVISDLKGTIITVTDNPSIFFDLERIEGDQDCKNVEELKVFLKKVLTETNQHRKGKAFYNLGMIIKKSRMILSLKDEGWKHFCLADKEKHPSAIIQLIQIIDDVAIPQFRDAFLDRFTKRRKELNPLFANIPKPLPNQYPEYLNNLIEKLEEFPYHPVIFSHLIEDEYFYPGKNKDPIFYSELSAAFGSPEAAIVLLTLVRENILKKYPDNKIARLKEIVESRDRSEYETVFTKFYYMYQDYKKANRKDLMKQVMALFHCGYQNKSLSCACILAYECLGEKRYAKTLSYLNTAKKFLAVTPGNHLDLYYKLKYLISNEYNIKTMAFINMFLSGLKARSVDSNQLKDSLSFWSRQDTFEFKPYLLGKLAEAYEENHCIPTYQSHKQEIEALIKKASQNDYDANLELGLLELFGISETGKCNPGKAVDYFENRILKNSKIKLKPSQRANIQLLIGYLYLDREFFDPTKQHVQLGKQYLKSASWHIPGAKKYLKTYELSLKG